MVTLNKDNIHPIRYCVMDNDNGPLAYVYDEKIAIDIVKGMNHIHGIDHEVELEQKGFCRFAYEDMRQYPADGHLPPMIMAQLALGFFG